ncbi:hypothetical protein [Neopusillimonas aromaticivorans]|uniref:hypothetical protein n=1 Tax=Neopusillimonas aromaticivorans TaxID=2979868 RepID=UPI0033157A7D
MGLPSPEELMLNGQLPDGATPSDGIGDLLNQLDGSAVSVEPSFGPAPQPAQTQRVQF